MSAETLKTAQQLIKERRYDDARALLLTLDHPLAPAWLESIRELTGNGERHHTSRRRRLFLLALAVVIVVAGAVAYLVYVNRVDHLALEAKETLGFVDPSAEIQAECDRRGYTAAECQNWMMTQVLNVAPPPGIPVPGQSQPAGDMKLPPLP
jgi:hypothetical protein